MLDFLYTFFVAPIEYWMRIALLWGKSISGNWGGAVLLMSLIVNFAILPIYMKAEKWQEEERAIQKSFEAKEAMIRRAFKGQERFAMLSTMQRQAKYSPILKLRSSVGFFLQIPFFFAAYHFLSHFEPLSGVAFLGLPDLGKPDGLIAIGNININVMPFVMTVVNLASALIYTKNLTKKDKNQLYAMAALFLVLLYDATSGLVLYWTFNNVFSLAKNAVFARFHVIEREWHYEGCARFSAPGFVLVTFLFLYLPFLVLLSDLNGWDMPSVMPMVDSILAYFFAVVYLFALFAFLLPKKLGKFFYIGSFLVLLSSFFYGTIFTGNYGTLQGLVFEKPSEIYETGKNLIKDIGIFVLLIGLLKIAIYKRLESFIKILCFGICAAIFVSSALSVNEIRDLEAGRSFLAKKTDTELDKARDAEYLRRFTTFSTTGKNVLVYILDMFTGEHVERIVQDYPDIAKGLDGFTWYEDTLASGSGTCFGIPAIYGGEDFTYRNLEKRGLRINAETLATAADVIPNALGKSWLSFNARTDYVGKIPKDGVTWPAWYWYARFAQKGWIGNFDEEFKQSAVSKLYTISAFKISPYSFRRNVYKRGSWWQLFKKFSSAALNEYAFFEKMLSEIQGTQNVANTYKTFHTSLTHTGRVCSDIDFLPVTSPSLPETQRKKDFRKTHKNFDYEHYISEVANLKVLIRIFEKMKELGIYDNTRIILVSDHGSWDSHKLLESIGEQPFRDNYYGRTVNPGMRSALLMVKDFGLRGNLKIDKRTFMSNYDIKNIVLKGILDEILRGGVQGLSEESENRVRYYEAGSILWNSKKEHELGTLWRVNGSMYEKNNWELVFTRNKK